MRSDFLGTCFKGASCELGSYSGLYFLSKRNKKKLTAAILFILLPYLKYLLPLFRTQCTTLNAITVRSLILKKWSALQFEVFQVLSISTNRP